jgi:hypothetical protein
MAWRSASNKARDENGKGFIDGRFKRFSRSVGYSLGWILKMIIC